MSSLLRGRPGRPSMTPSYAARSMKSSRKGSSKCRRIVICPWSFVLGHSSLVIGPWSLVICRATAVPSFRFQSLPARPVESSTWAGSKCRGGVARSRPARRSSGLPERRRVPGPRIPIPGDLPSARRRHAANPVGPSSAVLAVPLSHAPRAPFPVPRSLFPPFALGTGVPRFPAPRSRFPVPRFWELSTTAYAHPSMSKTIKFESKSIKTATFSVKKASKRRAFRHAHLNILGGHPLPPRRGPFSPSQRAKKARFRALRGEFQSCPQFGLILQRRFGICAVGLLTRTCLALSF